MHDKLEPIIQNPSQNFAKTSSILKNAKMFSKTQKPRSNAWNAWRMKDLGPLPVKKHLI